MDFAAPPPGSRPAPRTRRGTSAAARAAPVAAEEGALMIASMIVTGSERVMRPFPGSAAHQPRCPRWATRIARKSGGARAINQQAALARIAAAPAGSSGARCGRRSLARRRAPCRRRLLRPRNTGALRQSRKIASRRARSDHAMVPASPSRPARQNHESAPPRSRSSRMRAGRSSISRRSGRCRLKRSLAPSSRLPAKQ